MPKFSDYRRQHQIQSMFLCLLQSLLDGLRKSDTPLVSIRPTPYPRNTRISSTCPLAAAKCNGVDPSCFLAFASVPRSRSRRATSTCPLAAATCNESDPSSVLTGGPPLYSGRKGTSSGSPFFAPT